HIALWSANAGYLLAPLFCSVCRAATERRGRRTIPKMRPSRSVPDLERWGKPLVIPGFGCSHNARADRPHIKPIANGVRDGTPRELPGSTTTTVADYTAESR